MLKRGVDTLKMEDYQILYCEEGLATGPELDGLMVMSSAEHFVRPQALPYAHFCVVSSSCPAMPRQY